GKVSLGAGVKIGYFDQLLSCLNPNAEAVDAVRPDHKEFVEQQRRDLLARFGVTGDMVFQKVSSFSGGERNRTALAKLSASDANLLILDEPTNHLDLWARQSLEKSLKEFDGSVLFVSHDRYFLNQVADHLLVVEPTRFRVIDGNYETYLHFVREGLAGDNGEIPAAEKPAKKKDKREKQARPKRRFPYRKTEDIEEEIFEREARINELHEDLASPEVLRDGDKVKAAQEELQEQTDRLAQLYEHWEEASELN
ncbi:MAG: ABC-F family ATP-binding cassette domain-containing protein, partial [Verrucomicrobiae bacterium]|nr:ABC-F family ATP-binding cassette domain-containing protein [Verrucomicrobiae bacterium]